MAFFLDKVDAAQMVDYPQACLDVSLPVVCCNVYIVCFNIIETILRMCQMLYQHHAGALCEIEWLLPGLLSSGSSFPCGDWQQANSWGGVGQAWSFSHAR